MNQRKSSSLAMFGIRYGTAVLLVTFALGLTLLIWVFVKPLASPLFLVAIMIAAWRNGFRAGVLATLLSGPTIDYVFIPPLYRFAWNFNDVLRLTFFTFEGLVLSWLVSWRIGAAEEIRKSREQLQSLSLREQTSREEERKRIALEIHDELGQALTALKMEIHLLNRQVEEIDKPVKSAHISERLKDMMHLIDSTVALVRRIATDLRPPNQDDFGLVAAIEWQTKEFGRRTGISCVLSTNAERIELDSAIATTVFRIYQETLTNIIRHAEANTLTVNLKKLDAKLILRVEDDGKGIQTENIDGALSLGIFGMRERARLINGQLEVTRGENGGTIVLLNAPLS